MGLSLYGKTVGLVGMGDIAREAAKKFYYASSCKIIVYSPTSPLARWTFASSDPNETIIPHERVNTLDELLERSDVVSLHCPEVPETLKMMSKDQFAKMKSTAIFLNLGRGGLTDEEALLKALKSRQIFGAGRSARP
jgi:phosphoglycerate dehydrogenase-like enzyme